MAEQDTARTIIFDLVQLEKLGAELERRYRINPTMRAEDVLSEVDSEDHMLYLPQLNKLLEGLVQRQEAGTLEPLPPAVGQAHDVGDELRRSLMATALIDGSEPQSSSPPSSKISAGASGAKDANSSQTPERIDQFRILRELGTGAFGVVYLAEDESLQRKVAIKVPKVSDPRRSESYINEARKAAAIDCKGIVPIYHVGTKEDGIPFVVQKLIDGPSLRVLLSRYGCLPPAHAVTLMRDISVALASAHRLGIYHRDLKPDNVLLDGSGVPWIADFGLAISESEQAQRKGEIAGTLMYMSPEQIQGRADWLDGRSDIWALGIMLYELLLGKPPFSGKNRQSLMEQICHREPRPLQQSAPELAPLNDVFKKCCAKKPGDRFASVEELSEILTVLINEGLSTQPIDGSVLQLEQPISQYPSGSSQGTRSRSATATGATHRSSHAGSTHVGGGSATQLSGGVGQSSQAHAQPLPSATASSGLAPVAGRASATSKAEQWTRGVMIAVGVASLLAIAAQQWYSRQPSAAVAHSAATSADSAAAVSRDQAAPATVAAVSESVPQSLKNASMVSPKEATEQEKETKTEADAKPPSANALGLSEADGSAELPWVVAPDGSGSHRTIAAAIAAKAPSAGGAFVKVMPGTYEEALKISQPLSLIGIGEPDQCVISNAMSSPVEITCDLGTVRLINLAIRGDGRRHNKEFNAIELISGKLRLENCRIKSTVWNAVKIRPGASLVATGCKFEESRDFAITGKSHIGIEISDCEFFESGVQIVEGTATIQRCKFNGNEGVYVEQSGEVPARISNCHFRDCFKYGVTATLAGAVELSESTFESCKRGVLVSTGEAVISQCTMTNCEMGIELVGGDVLANAQTQITGGMFGCALVGGALRLEDVALSEFSDSAIIALDHEKVELANTTISQCGTRGLTLKAGTLRIEGGSIQKCGDAGIYIGESFTRGDIKGTHFESNLGAAIIQDSGDLNCTDVSIKGGENAIVVYNPEQPVNVEFQRVAVTEIKDVIADIYGSVVLSVRECDFGAIAKDNHYRALGGAEVKPLQ